MCERIVLTKIVTERSLTLLRFSVLTNTASELNLGIPAAPENWTPAVYAAAKTKTTHMCVDREVLPEPDQKPASLPRRSLGG